MAFSRMPKCMLRPAQFSGFKAACSVYVCMGAWTKISRSSHHLRQTRAEDLDQFS